MLFYLPDFAKPILPETEARHVLQVLRMKAGDVLDVTDAAGQKGKARLLNEKPGNCLLQVLESETTDRLWTGEFWLAVAPTKNLDRMEWLVEKATEIGCQGFHFFRSRRTERNQLNTERLNKIALSAMKQSGQFFLPQIHWHDKLQLVPFGEFNRIITADLSAKETKIKQGKHEKILLLIGPEGDFTPEELDFLAEKKTESLRFLPQVLRTETAALYSLMLARSSAG
jgi:16S rRNA (uracil1498-N3)-methyltransferase